VDHICEQASALRGRHPSRWVCVTGGEPLAQDLSVLARRLKDDNWKIHVETNGLFHQDLPVDWYTVYPKPESFLFHEAYTSTAREVKLVVTRELSPETITRIRKLFPERTPVFLQAQDNAQWSLDRGKELVEAAARNNLYNIRLSVQLHKILGLP